MSAMSRFPAAVACVMGAATCQEVLWRVDGVGDQVRRGFEVHRLGDVNGDGWEDMIELGAGVVPQGAGCNMWECVWITSGRDGQVLSTLPWRQNITFWPLSVAPLGDMDADGIPDYAVTTYDTYSPSGTQVLEVRRGRDHGLIWSSTVTNNWTVRFGDTIAGGMDLNGDGRKDLVTSATRMSPGGTVIAYDNSGVELYRLIDPRPDLLIGVDLAPLGGDLDQDGGDDFLMACPDWTNRGAVCVVSGRTGTILRIGWGEIPGDKLSFCTGTGDLDGDGVLDFAGGGYWGYPVVRAFSGATGQPIHTWRATNQGNMGWNLIGGFDLDQDGVNDLLAGSPGNAGHVHALSGRDGTFLYSFASSAISSSNIGDAVAMLGPPPGEQYPLLVYSEHSWQSQTNWGACQMPGRLWALRGSPPTVRAFGAASAAAGQRLSRMGMRDLPGPDARFTLSGAAPGSMGVLMLGWSDQAIGSQPLPLQLGGFGLPGITLWTSTEAVIYVPAGANGVGAGFAQHPVRVPFQPGGVPVFAQWLWLDPADPLRHGATSGHRFLVR